MNPVESAARWHRWAAKGNGSVLSELIDKLDARQPDSWKRLRDPDLRPYGALVRQGSAWYGLDITPSHAGVTLSLDRLGKSELRGGRVWFSGAQYPPMPPTVPAAWDQVMRFLDEGIIPAAQAAGAEITLPASEDAFVSELPADVATRLQFFSRSARKSLPLNRDEAELWHGFVVAAFRARSVIDPQQFADWLVKEAWPADAAAQLNLRFLDDSVLLSRYADEVSAV